MHVRVEAFRNGVVLREAPHSDDLLLPGLEGLGQLEERLEPHFSEPFQSPEEEGDQAPALPPGPLLDQEQPAEALLKDIQVSEGRVSPEIFQELGRLLPQPGGVGITRE